MGLLNYVLQSDEHNRLTPRVIDIAYTAFNLAKRPNSEDGGSSDWFNDTKPTVESAIAKLRKDLEEAQNKPIDMVLYCPKCGMQHIDRDESPSDREWAAQSAGDREIQYWTNPPHRSHLCQNTRCGHVWRPADVPTNGVAAIKTTGKSDTPLWKGHSDLRMLIGCFDAAISEGLMEALRDTTDERLKDLIERRLIVGYEDALITSPTPKD